MRFPPTRTSRSFSQLLSGRPPGIFSDLKPVSRARVLLVLLLVTASGVFGDLGTVTAQETVRVEDPRGGPPFRIIWDTVAVLSDNGDGIGPTWSSVVARDAKGQFWMGPTWVQGKVGLWSAEGQFLGTLGDKGGGPGELESVNNLWVGAGDTLNILSPERGRDVFGPEGDFVRRHTGARVGGAIFVLPLLGGGYVWGGTGFLPGQPGSSVHVESADGVPIRSLGTRHKPTPGTGSYPFVVVAMQSDSTIWYGLWREYLLEHWTLGGELLGSIERSVDWFPSPGEARRNPMDGTLQWLHCDSQDRLWIGLTAPRRREGTQRVVEVIDARSGAVLAWTAGVRRPIDGWIEKDLAWKMREMETGDLQALILRPRLVPR